MSQIQEYKCPCCGGAIEFDANLQKMKCPYCDTEFEMETLAAYDRELHMDGEGEGSDTIELENEAGGTWDEGETDHLRVYICNSCGGEIVGDETLAATACPFCDNPVVMMGQFKGDLKPDVVIPFKIDKKAAIAALNRHYEGKRLLPKVFRDQNHIEEVKGVYVPFWLFDADANAHIRYKATRVRHWSDSRYNYTETSFYSVIRGGSVGFEHVPIDGSSKIDDTMMESLEPFNFADAVDFQTAYLAGYLADKYDVDADASRVRANERIKQSTEAAFAQTVRGYSSVVTEHSNIQMEHGKAKYALYPVWLLNTDWNGTKYKFAVNGQTAKTVGDLPLDKGAALKWFFGLLFGIGAAVFLLQYIASL